jgi:hypothetical protein
MATSDAGKTQLNAKKKETLMETIMPEISQLLIDCLKKDGPKVEPSMLSGLSPEQWHSLISLAAKQRVSSLFWNRLREKDLDGAVPIKAAEHLRDAFRRNTMRNLRFYGELRRLLSALKREGIPLILLKGIYMADAVYDNIGLREMNDLDVLARPADLERIAAILKAMEYTSIQPICAYITINAHNHLPSLTKHGYASFEIHWNLTNPGLYYSIDPDGLWKRAVPVYIAGCDALALSHEDLLLHLCLHTSYKHQFAFGLRPSCDIAETISRLGSGLNWHVIIQRACSWNWQRGVYLALLLARELAGAEVPEEALKRLRPEDITDAILNTARAQIFADKRLAVSIPVPFADLLEKRRLWDKILIFWKRVFLPKALIASHYSVPMDSWKIYGCYPRRFIDVLRRHGHTLKKYRLNDAPMKSLVERKNRIADWLAGSCKPSNHEPHQIHKK